MVRARRLGALPVAQDGLARVPGRAREQVLLAQPQRRAVRRQPPPPLQPLQLQPRLGLGLGLGLGFGLGLGLGLGLG